MTRPVAASRADRAEKKLVHLHRVHERRSAHNGNAVVDRIDFRVCTHLGEARRGKRRARWMTRVLRSRGTCTSRHEPIRHFTHIADAVARAALNLLPLRLRELVRNVANRNKASTRARITSVTRGPRGRAVRLSKDGNDAEGDEKRELHL